MRLMRRGTLLTTLLLLTSCSSMPWQDDDPRPVEAGLLAYVPESGKQEIQQARAQRAQVREDLAISKRDLEQVESRVSLAENDLDVLESRREEAEDQVEHARKYGTQEELQKAEERLQTTQAAVRLASTKVRYYEDLEQLAGQVVELQEARLELASARIEAAEAEAIATLDRPAAQDVDLNAYRERVRRLEDQVAMHQVEARATRMKVDLRREFLDDRAQAVPASFRMNEPEAVDELLSFSLDEQDKPWEGSSEGMQQRDAQRREMQRSQQGDVWNPDAEPQDDMDDMDPDEQP